MAFPSTVLNLSVELALGADLTANASTWAWTDITSYVYARDYVRIQRGRPDGATETPPSLCQFTVDNGDGRFCAYDPLGAWYGQIGLGTPVRVKVDEGTESVRWTGFLSALPPRWSQAEVDRYVPISASGILQRLERGQVPLRSPLARAISGGLVPAPVAYWPGEDGSGSRSIAEFFGGAPMVLGGTSETSMTFASDGPSGSAPLPEFTNVAGVTGTVPVHETTGEWTVSHILNFPAAPSATTVLCRWYTTGTYPMWQVILATGSPDTVILKAYDTSGTEQISDSMTFGDGTTEPYGEWLLFFADAAQNGANVDYEFFLYDPISGIGGGFGATENSITAGRVTKYLIPASALTNGMHAGHWAVWNNVQPLGLPYDQTAMNGYDGESVLIRVGTFNGEDHGVSIEMDAISSEVTMGPEIIGTVLDVARGFETASAGRLYENMDPTAFNSELHLKFADDLANQDPALELDHDAGHLAPPFEPTDDDLALRNDWTATRVGGGGTGSSFRVVATTGNLTPEKVGTYDDSVSVNVETDDQLPHQAGWRLNVGTYEGLRFPSITLDFAHDPDLIPDWIGVDIGSRVTIENPPAGIPPDDIDVLVEGYAEVLGPYTWRVQLNCSPYKPYRVMEMAETSSDTNVFLGRLAEDPKAALRAALTDSATGATNFDPNFYPWSTTADDFPLNIRMSGEVITLSGISSSAASYVAAGAASHADNAAVTPALYAGAGIRQLILVFAAIRSSGTGTLVTPTDYTRLPVFPESSNAQLFAKVHTGSESNPTVTPSGGASGDTVSAFTFGFTVVPSTLGTAAGTSLSDIVVIAPFAQLNASAANIAYGSQYPKLFPGGVHLILGWKQDDYTSVAVPGGFIEILEASTTTGNDQSLYAAYKIDTTPTLTAEGSLAVTGGASAISRSAVCVLAGGIQVMTISARSVNGVVKAHSAGALIEVEAPGVQAL